MTTYAFGEIVESQRTVVTTNLHIAEKNKKTNGNGMTSLSYKYQHVNKNTYS